MSDTAQVALDDCREILRSYAPMLAEAAERVEQDDLGGAGQILEQARAGLWDEFGCGREARSEDPLTRAADAGWGWDELGPYWEILHKPLGGTHTMVLTTSLANPDTARTWTDNDRLAQMATQFRAEVPARLREMATGWAGGVPVFFR